jgi:hypothetical protein
MLAKFTRAAVATEIADHKTLTLEGARRAITAAVAQAHKNHPAVSSSWSMTAAISWALERADGMFAAAPWWRRCLAIQPA